MEPYKLSIVIPSFNRAPFLRECLDSIFRSAEGFESYVEVLVSDNHSTDSTQEVLAAYAGRKLRLRAIRPSVHLPAESNFRFVAEKATGKYIWIVGDDDTFERKALAEVLPRLDSDAAVFVLNFSIWDNHLERLLKPRFHALASDTFFEKPDDLMTAFGLSIGLISSVVIKKDVFFALSSEEYLKYVEYGFPFVYAVYYGLLPNKKAVYLSEPLVINRAGNSGNYDWYKFFVAGSSLIFDRLNQCGYSRSSTVSAKYAVINRYVFTTVLSHKRNGANLAGVFPLLLKHYYGSARFWFLLVPELVAPGFLLRWAWSFYHKFVKHGAL